MNRRAWSLIGLWLGAFVLCAAVEWILGRRGGPTDVIWSGLFLPITAVVGGRAAFGSGYLASGFLGLVFWPVWIVLARLWLKNGPRLGVGIALEMWMLLGFAQPLARFYLVMSA